MQCASSGASLLNPQLNFYQSPSVGIDAVFLSNPKMASYSGSSNPFNEDVAREQQRSRMEQTQAQVNEVVGIMQANVSKVMERDTKLSELDARADALSANANIFQVQSRKVSRKMWWRNLKWTIIMGLVAVAIVTIISVWIASEVNKGNGGDNKDGKAFAAFASVSNHTATGNEEVNSLKR